MLQEEDHGRAAQRRGTLDAILMGGGMLLFLAMLWTMQTSLDEGRFVNPLLLGLAAGALLWPLREHRPARTVLLAGGGLLLVWLLVELSVVLAPFVAVFVLAYLFDPVATRLQERFRIARRVSALAVTALVVGLVALVVLGLVPRLLGELETLAVRAVESVGRLQAWLASSELLDRFAATGLVDRDALAEQVTLTARGLVASLTESLPAVVEGLVEHLGSVLGVITVAAIVPVLLFYTLKDYPHIKARLEEIFPTVGGERAYLVQTGRVVGSYLRGQLTICAIATFNVSVLLLIFGVPFALLIGLLAGLLNVIPNLGAILTMLVGVLVALVFGDPWLLDVVTVVLVLLGQNLLEGSVLTPRIMSSQVGLHPVLILLSLFVFGYLLGFVGLIVAVPATALLMTAYKAYREELTFDLSPEARLKRDLSQTLAGRVGARARGEGRGTTERQRAEGGG